MQLDLDIDIDEIFETAFTAHGSPVISCSCGREHICIESYAFQNDEDDEAQRLAYIQRDDEGNDENLILHYGMDHIGILLIGDVVFAAGCECKGWLPFQKFVVDNRTQLRTFLIELADQAQLALDREATFNTLKDKRLNVLDASPF